MASRTPSRRPNRPLNRSDTTGLKSLGGGPRGTPSRALETFPNPNPRRDYLIRMEMPEFTCLCPKTGQPDFATLHLAYIPDQRCVELKSLKLYIWSFRDEGHFHEAVTNAIADDLVRVLKPRFLRLTADFYVRGGIYTTVEAEHRSRGWRPVPRIDIGPEPAAGD